MRRLIKYILMPFLVLVGFSRPMSAAMLPQVPLDFDSVSVSLITCYPGPEIYKLYGHTALRVRYGERDVMFNYGVFAKLHVPFCYGRSHIHPCRI